MKLKTIFVLFVICLFVLSACDVNKAGAVTSTGNSKPVYTKDAQGNTKEVGKITDPTFDPKNDAVTGKIADGKTDKTFYHQAGSADTYTSADGTFVYHNQKTNPIPLGSSPAKPAAPSQGSGSSGSTTNPAVGTEEYYMAQVIEAEAGGQSLKGKQAVAAVIMNRKDAGTAAGFANSVRDVLNQDGQFSCVRGGKVKTNPTPSQDSFDAAHDAYANGKNSFVDTGDTTGNKVYYYSNPATRDSKTDKWFNSLTSAGYIGDHEFYKP